MFTFHIEKEPVKPVVTQSELIDLLVIGAGPAGLNAALYAKRKGLSVVILTKEIGGQLRNTTDVDNYLGFKEVQGEELAHSFLNHVTSLDVPIMKQTEVQTITKENDLFLVKTNDTAYQAKTLLITTGGAPRKLAVPGEREFANKGVSYCTTCDAPFFKDKHVIVAGGGNSAAEAVLDLVPWANKITVVHRSNWRADPIILDKLNKIPNLTIYLNTQIEEVVGDKLMKGVNIINKQTNQKNFLAADGLFVEIGTIPNSNPVAHLVKLNEQKEIIVDSKQMTSLPGLFAAGDVTDQPHKQIIIAAAQGAVAALSADQYIKKERK
ncbi:MAG: FAD-dependent oxidoreductase [Bacilli bacterium]|jgi:alkyl hydroperoxide reductase subunit F|nr:FAD-dependent oxidoreductase [Bacilli bacterium]